MDECVLLDVRLQMEQVICAREAMIAENKQRERQGHSMAWDEESFVELTERLEQLRGFLT